MCMAGYIVQYKIHKYNNNNNYIITKIPTIMY